MAALTGTDEARCRRERPGMSAFAFEGNAVYHTYSDLSEGSERGHMCPACIESAVVMVAGAASTGGILVACIGKLRKSFKASSLSLFQEKKEK